MSASNKVGKSGFTLDDVERARAWGRDHNRAGAERAQARSRFYGRPLLDSRVLPDNIFAEREMAYAFGFRDGLASVTLSRSPPPGSVGVRARPNLGVSAGSVPDPSRHVIPVDPEAFLDPKHRHIVAIGPQGSKVEGSGWCNDPVCDQTKLAVALVEARRRIENLLQTHACPPTHAIPCPPVVEAGRLLNATAGWPTEHDIRSDRARLPIREKDWDNLGASLPGSHTANGPYRDRTDPTHRHIVRFRIARRHGYVSEVPLPCADPLCELTLFQGAKEAALSILNLRHGTRNHEVTMSGVCIICRARQAIANYPRVDYPERTWTRRILSEPVQAISIIVGGVPDTLEVGDRLVIERKPRATGVSA